MASPPDESQDAEQRMLGAVPGVPASAYQLVGVAREVVREEQVETRHHGSEREPDRHHNGDEETAADAPRKRGAAHPSV